MKKRKQELLPRSKVAIRDTWDLTPLFKSDEAWRHALKKLERQIEGFNKFRGKLSTSPSVLKACCQYKVAFEKTAERIGSYAFLKSAEDLTNSTYQGMIAEYTRVATRAEEASSFICPEIQAIPRKRMKVFLESPALREFRFMLEKILRFRPHILSAKEELLLAMQGEVSGAMSRIFGQLNDGDMKFGEVIDHHGRRVSLTHASFRSLLESPDRRVRKEAFQKYYAQYEAHANTLAATLQASVLQDVYYARARRYSSSLEAALFPDNVPVSVYENLIAAVRESLPTVYRYLDVRRRCLRLTELHAYDTYVPLAIPKAIDIPYEKAVSLICEALQPLGKEYCDTLKNGLLDRWVDRYENLGKRSGAFSAGGYYGPPYILMNYRDDTIDSVFTLAHEAGHSMHTYYSARNQPFQYYQYEIFVAEVASTFNEQLLTQFLLAQTDDPQMKAFLINREIDEIRGTLVRQTMFAEFEKIIHEMAEAGEPLTLESLREQYRNLLQVYFGKTFVIDPPLTLEGLRIPHFYHAFYVYKYATGLSAAIALAEKVLSGGKKERDVYLRLLKAGGSKYPLELLRDAGVDMEKPEPIYAAMRHLEQRVNQLDALLKN
ncbi:MAG TPA: oligoendopeptidase F [Candidatus Hydrogenedentes bacterium]|nr:oligoendopeptidase F [Candidatus Hydrogenedentota bacterium]HOL77555.1 oligoendopeptidase F [Candidatus Hydrogenedentota bacterium]HPO84860.1 oligoendopeptidase F [Candidatus Hydrogenedentota bacterium]